MPLTIFLDVPRGWNSPAVRGLANCKVSRQSCRMRAGSRPRLRTASCAKPAGDRGGSGAEPPRLPEVAGPLRNKHRICGARTAKAGILAEEARQVSRDDTLQRRKAPPGNPVL